MLTPDQQSAFLADSPEIFLPVAGGWGRHGVTHVRLAEAPEPTLAGALQTAWNHRLHLNQATALKAKLRSRSA